MLNKEFLPVNRAEVSQRGWDEVDFVLVSGDAYVDHPSFGAAIIGRVLEAEGYKIAMLAQPDYKSCESFREFGRPKYGFLISGGVVDSMVAHYTAAKRLRSNDEYSPGGKPGKRPDRVIDVYSRLAKQAYPDVPVVVGGVEASLRRFAHYDYWDGNVRPSILVTSGADMIVYGMGERAIKEVAGRLAKGKTGEQLLGIDGTACLCGFSNLPAKYAECASFDKVRQDKTAYAKACRIQLDNQDAAGCLPVVQKQTVYEQGKENEAPLYLVQYLPARPLSRDEFDAVYELPFTRRWHPMYDESGGIPALEEVEFSIIHNRGCYGGCHFCAITMHQGRVVTSRSTKSVLEEAKQLTKMPGFKGYIHDVGGPTANFRSPSCGKQAKEGMCKGGKLCLAPSACPKLIVEHGGYLRMLRSIRELPGVKKVFIRSGIRYDYVMCDKDESFFRELVKHHVSGQLKVAPEHCSPAVLKAMGKPPIETYNRFSKRFYELCAKEKKEQYLVPYLISGHPGSGLKDAVKLAEYLNANRIRPEQVQDFYPTPGTVSTCMYYTGLNPWNLEPVFVAKGDNKAMQRALLQAHLPGNAAMVRKALKLCGREDLEPKLLRGQRTTAKKHQAEGPKHAGNRNKNDKGGKGGQSRGRKEADNNRAGRNSAKAGKPGRKPKRR